jgi:hypothetical protein
MAHPFADISFPQLAEMPDRTLERVLQHGVVPRAENLVGFEYRGYNTPDITRALGFQKFVKGFYYDGGRLAGYNRFVERPRSGLEAPWVPRQRRHGFFHVLPVGPGRYADYPNAVLLDYGAGKNGPCNPESRIRDFLVQVEPGNPHLYLGKAYFDLGITRVLAGYFALERLRKAPS